MITYILLTGRPPFQGESLPEIYNEILNEKLRLYKSDWQDLSSSALEFVKGMLRKNPEARLTPNQALAHKFITQQNPESKVKPRVLK